MEDDTQRATLGSRREIREKTILYRFTFKPQGQQLPQSFSPLPLQIDALKGLT